MIPLELFVARTLFSRQQLQVTHLNSSNSFTLVIAVMVYKKTTILLVTGLKGTG